MASESTEQSPKLGDGMRVRVRSTNGEEKRKEVRENEKHVGAEERGTGNWVSHTKQMHEPVEFLSAVSPTEPLVTDLCAINVEYWLSLLLAVWLTNYGAPTWDEITAAPEISRATTKKRISHGSKSWCRMCWK